MDEPRGDNQDDASAAWSEVTAGFVDLGTRLKTYFESTPDDETNDEIRSAWSEFTDAAHRLGRSVTTAFQDDEGGQTVRDAGGQFPWHRDDEASPESSDRDNAAGTE